MASLGERQCLQMQKATRTLQLTGLVTTLKNYAHVNKKSLMFAVSKKNITLSRQAESSFVLLLKSPFSCVNGSSIQYSFHVGTGATRHSLNIISDSNWNLPVSDMSVIFLVKISAQPNTFIMHICFNSYLCELMWDYSM